MKIPSAETTKLSPNLMRSPRKRCIVTDTAGLLITACAGRVMAGPRRGQDRLLGTYLSSPIRHVVPDQGFAGRFVDWANTTLN